MPLLTAEEMAKMPRNPIYDAPIEQRLRDLEHTVRLCLRMLNADYQCLESNEKVEQLSEGEFAIGNWIVRPRFV